MFCALCIIGSTSIQANEIVINISWRKACVRTNYGGVQTIIVFGCHLFLETSDISEQQRQQITQQVCIYKKTELQNLRSVLTKQLVSSASVM